MAYVFMSYWHRPGDDKRQPAAEHFNLNKKFLRRDSAFRGRMSEKKCLQKIAERKLDFRIERLIKLQVLHLIIVAPEKNTPREIFK